MRKGPSVRLAAHRASLLHASAETRAKISHLGRQAVCATPGPAIQKGTAACPHKVSWEGFWFPIPIPIDRLARSVRSAARRIWPSSSTSANVALSSPDRSVAPAPALAVSKDLSSARCLPRADRVLPRSALHAPCHVDSTASAALSPPVSRSKQHRRQDSQQKITRTTDPKPTTLLCSPHPPHVVSHRVSFSLLPLLCLLQNYYSAGCFCYQRFLCTDLYIFSKLYN